jgi:hypothetical protein
MKAVGLPKRKKLHMLRKATRYINWAEMASISATVSASRLLAIRNIMNSSQVLTPEKLINLPKVDVLVTSPSGEKAIFSHSVYSSQEKKVMPSFDLLKLKATTTMYHNSHLLDKFSPHPHFMFLI